MVPFFLEGGYFLLLIPFRLSPWILIEPFYKRESAPSKVDFFYKGYIGLNFLIEQHNNFSQPAYILEYLSLIMAFR